MRCAPLILLLALGCDDGESAAEADPSTDSGAAADGATLAPDAGEPDAARRIGGVLALNEIDCHNRDWVEVVNLGPGRVDLAGWTLSDGAEPYALEGLLAPNRFLRIREQDSDDDGFEFGIACGADTVVLRGPDGEVDEVAPPPLMDGRTWGRLPDGIGEWSETEPTPAAPNHPPIDPSASLYDPANMLQIDIRTSEASLDALRREPREYVPAELRLADEQGLAGPLAIRFRIKGRAGSFRPLADDTKSAFKVRFEERFRGQKRLTLNNLVQDPSMLHEWTAYRVFRALGVAAPRVGYAFVTLNGAVYGLYANIETPDDVFLERWFESTAQMYEGAYGQDLFEGQVANLELDVGEPGLDGLRQLVARLDAHPDDFYGASADLVDWPQVLTMMAAEIYLGHWDGYAPARNNFYLHLDADGRLSLLPWGTDQTFRARLDFYEGRGRLMQACMTDLECRAAYDAALLQVHDVASDPELPGLVIELGLYLRPWAGRDPRKRYSVERIADEVNATVEFLRSRGQELEALRRCLQGADDDGDGFHCGVDCDDDDPNTFPGAPEVCGDRRDQDCNGQVDDGFDCPDCLPIQRGPHRYLVCPIPRNYEEARAHCQAEGAEPAVVESEGEAVWLHATAVEVARQDYWLGADDRAVEGSFVWWNGAPLDYARWDEGEPNNAGDRQDCAHIRANNGMWNDRECEARQGVLCEDVCVAGTDEDGDGFDRCSDDCDDGEADAHPGAVEVCDGLDNDCNGLVDDLDECVCRQMVRDDSRYHVCTDPLSWVGARNACRELNSDLAVLQDAAEAEWLFERAHAVERRDYWFGLSDRDVEDTFVWVDGTEAEYTNWGGGEPSDSGSGEDCVHFWGEAGRWNDLPCAVRLAYICEQPR